MTESADIEPAIAQDGRVDPRKLDVAAKTPRKRRARNRPAPPDELRAGAKQARKRANARQYPPGVMLEPAGNDQEVLTAPHNDLEIWRLQLADAFGTRSIPVITTFMAQIEALVGRDHWDDDAKQWRLDENTFNAALAIVSATKPRNELEAALAAQMVAIHLLTMKVSARAIREDYDPRMAATAGKLARTFAIQMAELRAHRTRNSTARQSIKVRKELHQHVHYHDDRGATANGGQPRGRAARAADKCAALPGPQPGGESVSLSSDEGQEPVQATRR